MGSSYSDLILYYKCKNGTDKGPHNGETDKYSVTTKKETYKECVNYLKVTHEIKFNKGTDGSDYNVLLYDGNEKNRGNRVFGYYYPDKSKVLKEVHVYYSVLKPDDPLIISFVIKSGQTYNFTNDSLTSTRWCKAYNITYYSFNHPLSTEDLTNEFKKLQWKRTIKFVVGNDSKDVSGTEQKIGKNGNYRYVYIPNGDNGILGSNCLFKLNSGKPECNKTPEPAKPQEAKPQVQPQASVNGQSINASKIDNEIDPYYLDTFNGHFFDGIMVYFAKENTSNIQKPAQNGKNGDQNNNDNQVNVKKNEDNMALLLEFVDSCSTKRFLKRKDKNGYWWAEDNVEYTDDVTLNKQLKEIKDATKNDMTTFVLEKKNSFKGVTIKSEDKSKSTYTKYTHSATESNKPNLLFRKEEVKNINDKVKDIKTKTLDVYFLKLQGKEEQEYPFLLFFSEKNNQQQQPQPPPTPPNGSSTTEKNNEKCYHFGNSYDFNDWKELKVDKAPEEKKEGEQNGLEKKLEEKLKKIETNGACAKEIHHLRNIAYYILIDKKEEAKKPPPKKKEKKRPEVLSSPKVRGPGVVQILGYVTAGLVVNGTIGGGLYGIYWYNTTIKLLT